MPTLCVGMAPHPVVVWIWSRTAVFGPKAGGGARCLLRIS